MNNALLTGKPELELRRVGIREEKTLSKRDFFPFFLFAPSSHTIIPLSQLYFARFLGRFWPQTKLIPYKWKFASLFQPFYAKFCITTDRFIESATLSMNPHVRLLVGQSKFPKRAGSYTSKVDLFISYICIHRVSLQASTFPDFLFHHPLSSLIE